MGILPFPLPLHFTLLGSLDDMEFCHSLVAECSPSAVPSEWKHPVTVI